MTKSTTDLFETSNRIMALKEEPNSKPEHYLKGRLTNLYLVAMFGFTPFLLLGSLSIVMNIPNRIEEGSLMLYLWVLSMPFGVVFFFIFFAYFYIKRDKQINSLKPKAKAWLNKRMEEEGIDFISYQDAVRSMQERYQSLETEQTNILKDLWRLNPAL